MSQIDPPDRPSRTSTRRGATIAIATDARPRSAAAELVEDELARETYRELTRDLERVADQELDALCRRHPELEAALRREHGRRRTAARLASDLVRTSFFEELARELGEDAEPRGDGAARERGGAESVRGVLALSRGPARRFSVGRELERDRFGATWKARDAELRRDVALRAGFDEVSGRCVRAELEALRRLDHPFVSPLLHAGADAEGRLFFTTRWAVGRDLAAILDLLRRGVGACTLARGRELVLHAAEAVAHAHACGVAHGALAPDCIRAGPHGELAVIGWGRHAAERPLRDGPRPADDVAALVGLCDELARTGGGEATPCAGATSTAAELVAELRAAWGGAVAGGAGG